MKRNKLWIISMIGAAIAGFACLLPPILIVVLGSTAIANVPPWLSYILAPAFLILTASAVYIWYRRKYSARG